MKIRVRLFGYLTEKAGHAELEVESAPAVGAVIEAAERALPALGRLPSSVRFAVNTEYADRATLLKPGDVVSFIPPVGGG